MPASPIREGSEPEMIYDMKAKITDPKTVNGLRMALTP